MSNPKMTVNQLKQALDRIDAKYGEMPITIWLPGSLIDIACLMSPKPNIKAGELLLEGNLREGSALS